MTTFYLILAAIPSIIVFSAVLLSLVISFGDVRMTKQDWICTAWITLTVTFVGWMVWGIGYIATHFGWQT